MRGRLAVRMLSFIRATNATRPRKIALMSLVPCRACGHSVDTSALACPQCGATDPAHKLSRQQRNAISLTIQLIVGVALLVGGGAYLWREFAPVIKAAIVKTGNS